MTFQRRRCGHRTQREAGPFGVPPASYPRRHGERRDACEPSGPTTVSMNASCARGPCHSHVGPMTCTRALSPARGPDEMCVGSPAQVHVEGPACASRGSRACSGVRVRAARHARRLCAQTVDHLARNSPLSPVLPRWSALWAPHQPQPRSHCDHTGGNGVIRTTTRRRHAVSQALMLPNPHRHRHGGCWRARLRRPWAEAGPTQAHAHRPRPIRGRRVACGAWPDNEPTRRTTRQHTRLHWCGGRRRDRRARAGFEARRRTK